MDIRPHSKKLYFLNIFQVPILGLIGIYLGGIFTFLLIFYFFVIIPLVNFALGENLKKTSLDQVSTLAKYEKEKILPQYKYALYLYPFIHMGSVLWSVYYITHASLNVVEIIGLTLTMITMNTYGFIVAHELLHKNLSLSKQLARVIYYFSCWGFFFIEHLRGHHNKNLEGTAEDPSTPIDHESVYDFTWRNYRDSFLLALTIERNYLKKQGYYFWSYHNQLLWIIATPVTIAIILGVYFGLLATAFYILQSFMGISTYLTAGYIQHYGLMRRKNPDGTYEKFTHLHTWSCNYYLLNAILLDGPKHSDHHIRPYCPYYDLRHITDSPTLPAGYGEMMLLAWIPFLWRKVMDKKVEAIRAQIDSFNKLNKY